MEVAQLRALREVRDRGSIAAVAAAMHVTPSSVSQQLATLQRAAGVQLTRLEGRRTVLTEAGLALAAAAVEVELALARAEAVVAPGNRRPAPVRVSAFHSAAISLFPSLLHDGLAVELADADVATEHFPALTLSHDLVIAHRMVGSAPWPTTVTAVALMAEPLDLAFRHGHRLDGLGPVTPDDLVGESWIAVHEGFPLDQAVRRVAGAAGHDPRIAHRVNDFEIVSALIRTSDHVALLPRWLGRSIGDGVRLVPIEGDFGLARRVDVLARPEALHRPGVPAVVDCLRAAAAALVSPRPEPRGPGTPASAPRRAPARAAGPLELLSRSR